MDDGKTYELHFDPDIARRDFPDCERKPGAYMDALQAQNPHIPHEVLAALGAQLMLRNVTPLPGHEQAFYDALAWLAEEAKGKQVVDMTPGFEHTKAVEEQKRKWQQ